MKNFLLIAAVSILFPSSITKCSEDKKFNGVYTVIGIAAILGGLGYGIYHCTKSNTPSDNPSSTPNLSSQHQSQQKEDPKPNIHEQLNNPQSSGKEKHSENNNSEEKKESEKQESTDNKTLSSLKPKSNPEKKPSNGNPTQCQKNTSTPIMNPEKEISFSDALRARFKENETEHEAKRLLIDHAFSN